MNSREDLLMQIWRDYYDEILDVSLNRGTFESLMDPEGRNVRKGFIELEVMLTAQRQVHPDDRTAFIQFFDKKVIEEGLRNGVFVRKLNFRMDNGDGRYFWVKVKGIMPSEGNDEEKRYFVCFRILDNASDEDMSYRKLLSVSLMHEKEISSQLKGLFEKFASLMKDPLNDIIGLSDIAKSSVSDTDKTVERLELITEKTNEIDTLMEQMRKESREMNEEIALRDDESYRELVAKTGKNLISEQHKETHLKKDEEKIRVKNNEEKTIRKIGTPAVRTTADPVDFDFTGKKVLLVPDSELAGEIMAEMMSKRGAKVLTVLDGKAAVKEFIKNPAGTYDMVLVDTGASELDGYSIAHCIRLSCKDDAEKIPVFAVSNKGVAESIVKTKENGVNMIFSKPLDYGLLFLKMHEAMGTGKRA